MQTYKLKHASWNYCIHMGHLNQFWTSSPSMCFSMQYAHVVRQNRNHGLRTCVFYWWCIFWYNKAPCYSIGRKNWFRFLQLLWEDVVLTCESCYDWFFFNMTTIIFIIFWDFLMIYQIFLSPRVKRWAIITYKHGMYQLPHELLNYLRLRILEN